MNIFNSWLHKVCMFVPFHSSNQTHSVGPSAGAACWRHVTLSFISSERVAITSSNMISASSDRRERNTRRGQTRPAAATDPAGD